MIQMLWNNGRIVREGFVIKNVYNERIWSLWDDSVDITNWIGVTGKFVNVEVVKITKSFWTEKFRGFATIQMLSHNRRALERELSLRKK